MMDLASGYWQVAMSPDASRKAAFVTHEGLFQFRVMPFDLRNAPAMFERLMDRVLSGMRWAHCLVYLDDVISFGTDVPEALLRLTEVLERLGSFCLQLKAKKCTFMQTEVALLGHVVGRAGLARDPEKLSAVHTWHTPDWVKQVRQFVCFVGYYRRFIPDFAGLCRLRWLSWVMSWVAWLVGRAGLPCDLEKLSAVQTWHTPHSVKQVCQFVFFLLDTITASFQILLVCQNHCWH